MGGGKKRRWLSWVLWLGVAVLALAAAVGGAVWRGRIAVASRVVRKILNEQGLDDLSFNLAQVSPSRIVVKDIRLGGDTEPLLEIDRVEARFSLGELQQRHLDRFHVQGVRTTVLAQDGKLTSPLAERLQTLAAEKKKAAEHSEKTDSDAQQFSLWMATVRDVRVTVKDAVDGAPLAAVTLGAGAVADVAEPGRYRVWAQSDIVPPDAERSPGANLVKARLTGSVAPETGDVAFAPTLELGDVSGCLALARQLVPGVLPDDVVEARCSLKARGEFAVTAWTNLMPFEVSAEFGRNSRFDMPAQSAWVQFQSLRADVSGTLNDMQGRVSAGVSGFGFGKGVEASQEMGRMLSLRATGRFSQSETNQAVEVTLQSDLPGRSIAKVLPRVLPLVPAFFSDGGTLKIDGEATRPLQGAWQGEMRYDAEAVRSSMPMAGAYVGAQAVHVAGRAAIVDSKPGVVETDITLEDGYFFRDDVTVAGGFETRLTVQPPYTDASGTFRGQFGETKMLARMPLAFGDGMVPLEGHVAVTGLTTNPVWQVAVKVPESRAAWTQETSRVACTVGGDVAVRYSASGVAVRGGAWAHNVVVQSGAEINQVPLAGVERIEVAYELPEISLTVEEPDVTLDVTLSASNAWAAIEGVAELEDVRCVLPFRWSKRTGLAFKDGQSLSWRRLAAQGLEVAPDAFAWSADSEKVEARFGARIVESAVRVDALARVPLAAPKDARLTLTLQETALGADDAVITLTQDKAGGAEISGRVAAEAEVWFLGAKPHVRGWARLNDGAARLGKMEVTGLDAEVPFLGGVIFRTIEKPFVSFKQAKVDNIRLDGGRFDFQVTRRGVFVDRLEVGLCKGSLNAYSVDWDFKEPKDEFVVYADRIDLGEALMMVMPVKGNIEGMLYGRIPVGIDNGKLKLSTGFLYSLPGQGGALKLDDPTQMQALLDQSGIRGDVQVPLSKALSDMDFNMLRLEMEPREDGEGTLRIKLVGKSNDKGWPAPVDLNLNLHGPLEQLVNMGLDASRK